MAVFFTVQFGSQSRGIYKPANKNSEKGLPGKHCHTKSHLISKRMRGQSGK